MQESAPLRDSELVGAMSRGSRSSWASWFGLEVQPNSGSYRNPIIRQQFTISSRLQLGNWSIQAELQIRFVRP